MLLICHVNSKVHVFRGLCDFMADFKSLIVTHSKSPPCHVKWPEALL